ncbi:NAD+ synthase [Synechococcus sp. M16CYN]|uniref:NAD+ synthase n=1 Tax=Synechococcus sp. M16CYN TaxID=3103139 RepID=UPI003249DDF7
MRLALAQMNPLVGDLRGNAEKILTAALDAQNRGADLLITPELSLWGYPPRDLLLQPARIALQDQVLRWITSQLESDLMILVGVALPIGDNRTPGLTNSIVLVERRGWRAVAHKQLLPNYDVFDERRYFRPGTGPNLLFLPHGQRLGLTICEDLWVDETLQRERLAGPDPIAQLIPERPNLLLNLAASPFDVDKPLLRQKLAGEAARRLNCPVVYLNQVGGNDELIFDGDSFVMSASGERLLELSACHEQLSLWDSCSRTNALKQAKKNPLDQLFRVLVLGVRDYTKKCGFQKVLLGLSGGIDSSLVAVIATAALGADQVSALLMPSPWSSTGSINDALALAKRLNLQTNTLPIQPLMDRFDTTLKPVFGDKPQGVTAENMQSRIRGTLLMAVANQQGHLLLTTGNKSEIAVGYCTLYGDMNGGLAVIGDLYKTSVFALCDWLDGPTSQRCRHDHQLPESGDLVGEAIRRKSPSAELRPEQKDSDSLPDYSDLDPLLKDLIQKRSQGELLTAAGHDPELVKLVQQLLKQAEFKRRQAAPLLKVSPQAFGSGWRLPIACC